MAPASPRVALVGCGAWGGNLATVLSRLGALEAVVDPDLSAAEALSAQLGVEVMNLPQVWDSKAIEAVVVAAPAALHGEIGEAALEHGKHLFVEKPLALEVEQARRLCQLADASERVLMVGHLMQYHPAFLALLELVESGKLGRLQYLYSNRLNFGRFRREENALWSFAPHDVSMILRIVGDEPTAVTATGAAYLHGHLADVTTTHLEFAGGQRAHVFVSWLHPVKEQRLVVVGDRGMAVLDDGQPWDSKLVHYPHQVDWRGGVPTPATAPSQAIALEAAEPLELEVRHFLDCIRTGARPRTDGEEGRRVLEVLASAQASIEGRSSAPSAAPDYQAHETVWIDSDVRIGAGTRIWHFSHVLGGSRIGRDCTIGQNVSIGPSATVGDRCKIQNNVSVYEGVELADGVFCGPSAVFTNVLTPRAEVDRRSEFLPTRVGRGATIGANATIVCGNEIGEYSFVAAGAVVVKPVAAHALVAGVPARQIGWVSHAGERLGPDLVCPRSGQRYMETNGALSELEHGP